LKDRIVWVNGPFPAATHDITIFRGGTKKAGEHTWRKSSLYHKMPPGKRLIGDLGYVGEADKISTTLGGHSAETKKFFALYKSRQETLFSRYKVLNIFGGEPFRHKGKQGGGEAERLATHKVVFDAVSVVQQYTFEKWMPFV